MALCLFVREPTRASYVKEVRVCLAESWKQALRFTALPRVSHEAVDLMQRLLCEPVRFRVSVCRRPRTINYNPDFWSPPFHFASCHSAEGLELKIILAFSCAATCVTRSSRSKQRLLCEPEDRLGSMYLSVGILVQSVVILTFGLRSN